MRIGTNLSPFARAMTAWLSPDVACYAYPFDMTRCQTTLAEPHVAGDGVLKLAGRLTLWPEGSPTGRVVSGNVQVRDADSGVIVRYNVSQMAGSPYLYKLAPLSGYADRDLAAGSVVDDISGNSPWGNSNGLPMYPELMDPITGRPTGYPAGLASGQTIRRLSTTAYPSGTTLTLRCRGTGTIRLRPSYADGTTAVNQSWTVANGVFSPSPTFTLPADLSTLAIDVEASSPSDPIHALRAIAREPGGADHVALYDAHADDFDYFLPHPTFAADLARFDCVRFMGTQETNGTTHRDWADRNLPGLTPGKPRGGAAFEWMAAVAEGAGANAWYCVPHDATDDYVRAMATALKALHPAPRRLYVEYSNETWNNQPPFTQYRYCGILGAARFSPRRVTALTYDGGTGLCTATLPAHGYATGQMARVAMAADDAYNGSFPVTVLDADTFTYAPSAAPSSTPAAPVERFEILSLPESAGVDATAITWNWNTDHRVLIDTATPHGMLGLDVALVAGASEPALNGVFVLVGTSLTATRISLDLGYAGWPIPLPSHSGPVNSYDPTGVRIYRLAVNSGTVPAGMIGSTRARRQFTGRRTAQVHAIFREVFHDELDRLSLVLGIQAGALPNGFLAQTVPDYLAVTGGTLPPGPEYILSPAPYFDKGVGSDAAMLGEIKTITALTASGGTATATCNAHGFATGDTVQVFNAAQPEYCGLHAIAVTGPNTFTFPVAGSPAAATKKSSSLALGAVKDAPYFREVTEFSLSGGVLTCTSKGHGLADGAVVLLSGAAQGEWSGRFVATVLDADRFTLPAPEARPGVVRTPTASSRLWVVADVDAAIARILDAARSNATATAPSTITTSAGYAAANGFNLTCYEGGQHIILDNSSYFMLVDLYAEANRSAGMGALYRDYLTAVEATGAVPLLCVCNYCQRSASTGFWGHKEFQLDDGAPKHRALLEFIASGGADAPRPPEVPTLTVGAIGPDAATLVGSAFSDPDAGDVHAASRWQVTTAADTAFAAPILDTGDDAARLTSLVAGSLSPGTSYRARVRYKDSSGLSSGWSEAATFATTVPPNAPPATPSLSAGKPTTTGVALGGSAFFDSDGDAHAASQWQVALATDAGYAAPVVSTGDDAVHLRNYDVTGLTPKTGYRARVRYRDSRGLYSGWSADVTFTTATQPPGKGKVLSVQSGAGVLLIRDPS